ncbi:MAG: hypothetical protein PF517_03830 [Salinivirgaceae bacterium]|nr:hypothetical protein [Salinivirgaceae bacterium]
MGILVVKNVLGFVSTFYRLGIAFLKHKRFVKKYLKPRLQKAYSQNDGTLPVKQKIIFNYSILVPTVLGNAFCNLRAYSMTKNERQKSTLQSAFSALGDDFFDHNNLPDFSLPDLFTKIDELDARTTSEILFLTLFKDYSIKGISKEFILYFTKIHDAEKKSAEQMNKNVTLNKIRDITKEKGGYSLLFYRTAFENEITIAEEKLLYKLGECVQLANDAFDIYKDYKSGVHTLMTECKDFTIVVEEYKDLINEVVLLAYKTANKEKYVKQFLQVMSFAVFSRTLVCLNMLAQNQQLTGGIFKIATYSRKQLICDMEKPINILRSITYFVGLNYDA